MPRIEFRDGLRLSEGRVKIAFDSVGGPKTLCCISHAHSDHVVTHVRAIMTPETKSLISCYHRKLGKVVIIKNGGAVNLRGDLKIKLMDAGHVLGSSQFNVQGDGFSVTYTGDINTCETIITKPAVRNECDILIVESTYGDPGYIFPDRERLYGDILGWVSRCLSDGRIPAFKAYSIGKSQEIIKLLNEYTSLPVVVGPTVAAASTVYNEMGMDLRFAPVNTDEGAEILSDGRCVYVDSTRRRLPVWRRVCWAVATGWALRYRFTDYDRSFPLSSHADFKGLLDFIEDVKPKKVYTHHGFANRLAAYLRRFGYDAKAVDLALLY